jgi:hypothetical protein
MAATGDSIEVGGMWVFVTVTLGIGEVEGVSEETWVESSEETFLGEVVRVEQPAIKDKSSSMKRKTWINFMFIF